MEKFKDHSIIANIIMAYMTSNNIGLFSTHTVGELLWGYEDGLLKTLKLFQPDLDDVFGLFYKVCFELLNNIHALYEIHNINKLLLYQCLVFDDM